MKIEELGERMNAAFQTLTGEDGDNPPHFAVGQVTSGFGHSHVGHKRSKIHTVVKKKMIRPPSGLVMFWCLDAVSSSGRLRCAALLKAPPRPRPLTDDTWCPGITPTPPLPRQCVGRDVRGFRRSHVLRVRGG